MGVQTLYVNGTGKLIDYLENAIPVSIKHVCIYKAFILSFKLVVNYPSFNKLKSLNPFLCFTFLYTVAID